MTPIEMNKIINLIRSEDVTNIRLARILVGDPVPKLIKKAVLEMFGHRISKIDHGYRLRRITTTSIETIVFLKDDFKKLDLHYGYLTTLPNNISQLVNLKWLYLGSNGLTTLPESIGQLTNLELLRLNSNRLTILPGSIGQLANLKWLDLTYNQLTTLPESIGQLTKLEELLLDDNKLTTVPESIAKLCRLKDIDLRNNPISPQEIKKLESLLPHCKINR